MSVKLSVNRKAFTALLKVDVDLLSELTEAEIRPILPCLVRMSLIQPLDRGQAWSANRKLVLRILSAIDLVNSIVALLSIDFHALEVDVKKEQQLRQKIGGHMSDSILVQSLEHGLGLEFERSDPARRLRILLSELLAIVAQVREQPDLVKSSEIFDNDVYLEEVSDVLCIAMAELLTLLPPQDVVEALLHVKKGPSLICNLVANMPDCFQEVCTALIINGEKQDEDSFIGQARMQALRMLCQMNPSQSLAIRAKAVDQCRMPGLAVVLTLDHCRFETLLNGDNEKSIQDDLVAFITGLLLGNDCNVRIWFAHYVRNGQKKKTDSSASTINLLREELLKRLKTIVLFCLDEYNLPNNRVVHASALIRLYCALKGIAGFKFHDDEVNLLLQLLMSHPQPTPAGVRFVSLALCMLIACPSLIGTPELERKSIDWLKWLVKEEAYFERTSGVNASFGEVLLLIAIHFHSNQLNAISDLVCSTLGMKILIRPNNMARMKTIFTQDIFTEQVVTAHAVKVPVTPCLSANVHGFLPIHCIQQLLKSRAFSKHRVPIKDWIYRQMCNTVPPLHPVLPSLLEAYVNSIIIPSTKGAMIGDTTNEPISEDEIMALFKRSVFALHPGESWKCQSDDDGRSTPYIELIGQKQKSIQSSTSMTAQLLLLYYLLLYEDVRMANARAVVTATRNVKCYSQNFIAALPVKYLLQEAQKEQHSYAGLFSPLLRLLATHHPHLCLVEDWLYDDVHTADQWSLRTSPLTTQCTKTAIREAFSCLETCPVKAVILLRHLLTLTARQLWPFADCVVSQFPMLLEPGVPRHVHELFRQAWLKLNTIFPGRLWVLTVNALRPCEMRQINDRLLSQDDITMNPLLVLRCDERVFRCGPLLEIVVHILRAFLAASRIHLVRHLLANPALPLERKINEKMASGAEREELKNALVLAQESAAVQILLEICLPSVSEMNDDNLMSDVREIQTLVCTHLHQIFIADPHLVKLVHFQGYPLELIPLTVAGIPSMHIFLDFAPELLSQHQLTKQIFAIEMTSHLCLQYAVPKSFGVARLVINTMTTLLGVLPSYLRQSFFVPTLTAIGRICRAFPLLQDDAVSFLLQLGRICMSHASLKFNGTASSPLAISEINDEVEDGATHDTLRKIRHFPVNDPLTLEVQKTLEIISDIAILKSNVY